MSCPVDSCLVLPRSLDSLPDDVVGEIVAALLGRVPLSLEDMAVAPRHSAASRAVLALRACSRRLRRAVDGHVLVWRAFRPALRVADARGLARLVDVMERGRVVLVDAVVGRGQENEAVARVVASARDADKVAVWRIMDPQAAAFLLQHEHVPEATVGALLAAWATCLPPAAAVRLAIERNALPIVHEALAAVDGDDICANLLVAAVESARAPIVAAVVACKRSHGGLARALVRACEVSETADVVRLLLAVDGASMNASVDLAQHEAGLHASAAVPAAALQSLALRIECRVPHLLRTWTAGGAAAATVLVAEPTDGGTDDCDVSEFVLVLNSHGAQDWVQDVRDGAHLFLRSLPPRCLINIVCTAADGGGGAVVCFEAGSTVLNEDSLAAASAFIEEQVLSADKAAHLAPALQAAVGEGPAFDRIPRHVIVVVGEHAAEDQAAAVRVLETAAADVLVHVLGAHAQAGVAHAHAHELGMAARRPGRYAPVVDAAIGRGMLAELLIARLRAVLSPALVGVHLDTDKCGELLAACDVSTVPASPAHCIPADAPYIVSLMRAEAVGGVLASLPVDMRGGYSDGNALCAPAPPLDNVCFAGERAGRPWATEATVRRVPPESDFADVLEYAVARFLLRRPGGDASALELAHYDARCVRQRMLTRRLALTGPARSRLRIRQIWCINPDGNEWLLQNSPSIVRGKPRRRGSVFKNILGKAQRKAALRVLPWQTNKAIVTKDRPLVELIKLQRLGGDWPGLSTAAFFGIKNESAFRADMPSFLDDVGDVDMWATALAVAYIELRTLRSFDDGAPRSRASSSATTEDEDESGVVTPPRGPRPRASKWLADVSTSSFDFVLEKARAWLTRAQQHRGIADGDDGDVDSVIVAARAYLGREARAGRR